MNFKNGDMYRYLQCQMAYENLRMEGDQLSFKQVEAVFDDPRDDLIYDHFLGFDYVIYHLDDGLNTDLISNLHFVMTKDSSQNAGAYRQGKEAALQKLLVRYENQPEKKLADLLLAHVMFMRLRPFDQSNGKIARMLLFKECLRFHLMPFIIQNNESVVYHHSLANHDLLMLGELARYEQARLRLTIREPSAHLLHKVVNVRQTL